MQRLLVGFLTLTLLAGCGAPGGPAATARNASSGAKVSANLTGAAIFKRLDTSADGQLTLPEFQALGIFGVNGLLFEPNPAPPLPEAQAATFKSFDKNGDQAVSAREFENFGVALQYALQFDSPTEFYTTMFPTLDRNQDQRLTVAEWEQMGIFVADAPFKLLDRNQDGFLTLSELAAR